LSEPLKLTLPSEALEEIARRAAELVLEQLEARDEWLDSTAAAEYLGISRGTVHNLVSEGRLPRHGPKGARQRFRRSDLDAYCQGA
jgi:excisionase family DNA binding protein